MADDPAMDVDNSHQSESLYDLKQLLGKYTRANKAQKQRMGGSREFRSRGVWAPRLNLAQPTGYRNQIARRIATLESDGDAPAHGQCCSHVVDTCE